MRSLAASMRTAIVRSGFRPSSSRTTHRDEPAGRALVAAKDDGNVQFVVDGEQTGLFILNRRSAEALSCPITLATNSGCCCRSLRLISMKR